MSLNASSSHRGTPISSARTDNAFHGLKISFANEIGAICQALGLDSHQVM
ncbi:hypothetical protein ACWDTT_01635, partial [Streptosporangium sandarakinum]